MCSLQSSPSCINLFHCRSTISVTINTTLFIHSLGIKLPYLLAAEQSDEALLAATAVDGGQDATDILGNVAEIFSAGDIAIPWKRRNRGGTNSIHDNGNTTDCGTRNERPKATKSRFIYINRLLIFAQTRKCFLYKSLNHLIY